MVYTSLFKTKFFNNLNIASENVSKLHEAEFARKKKIAQVHCTTPNLHEGTILYKDDFAPRVNLHESKKNKLNLKDKLIKN